MATEESAFERKLREKQEALAAAGQAQVPPVAGNNAPGKTPASAYEHHAPTAEELGLNSLSPEEEALDKAIAGLDIIDAYKRWCKKMVPKVYSGQRESIKISCPDPKHPDKNPSAWINLDKQVYHCSGCGTGGDIWDIAAYHFGYPVPGYKDPQMFRELREKIAADLGFQTVTSVTGKAIHVPPATEEEKKEAAKPPAMLPSAAAQAAEEEEEQKLAANAPTIDWRSFLPEDTFLRIYMDATTVDTCPEEYHFWNAMLALGLAVGRDALLMDLEPVVPNLFVCLTGPSSAGKSRSTRHLGRLIQTAIPHKYNNPGSRGALHIKSPNSAEYLIHRFQSEEQDPSDPKNKIVHPVRGLVEFGELAGLMSVANRLGNNLKPQLMELYDANEIIESGSVTGGVRRAEQAFGSVISTTQNRSLRKLLDASDDGSGFINRWIFASGKEKPQLSFGGTPVELMPAAGKLVQIHQWSFGGKRITMSDEALAKWDEFFKSTVHPTQMKARTNGTAVIGRVDLLMKKLMLLFAINRMEDAVSKLSVEEAIFLWPYILRTFGVVSVEIKKTESTELRDEILSQITRLYKANNKHPSKRDVYNAIKRKVRNDKEVADLLSTMVRLGMIEELTSPAGSRGRPTTRYAVCE